MLAIAPGPPHPWRQAFDKLAAIDFVPPPEPARTDLNDDVIEVKVGLELPTALERARNALADRLRRFKQAGKRLSRQKAYQWCCRHGHVLAEIRFRTQVWSDACDLAGVPEWKRSGRIPGQQLVTDSEIGEP